VEEVPGFDEIVQLELVALARLWIASHVNTRVVELQRQSNIFYISLYDGEHNNVAAIFSPGRVFVVLQVFPELQDFRGLCDFARQAAAIGSLLRTIIQDPAMLSSFPPSPFSIQSLLRLWLLC
jgi:hypothetical protein